MSALGLVSRRRVTVLLNPLDEDFPLILVFKEPLANNFTLASDFENPLKDSFHPHEVGKIVSNAFLHEFSKE